MPFSNELPSIAEATKGLYELRWLSFVCQPWEISIFVDSITLFSVQSHAYLEYMCSNAPALVEW